MKLVQHLLHYHSAFSHFAKTIFLEFTVYAKPAVQARW